MFHIIIQIFQMIYLWIPVQKLGAPSVWIQYLINTLII